MSGQGIITTQLPGLNDLLCQRNMRIIRSPGDGHCLIHSIVASWNSQFPELCPVDNEGLMSSMFVDAVNNCDGYMMFLQPPTKQHFSRGLRTYLLKKEYNQQFGDIAPLIVANALGVNIKILDELSSGRTNDNLCVLSRTGDKVSEPLLCTARGITSKTWR